MSVKNHSIGMLLRLYRCWKKSRETYFFYVGTCEFIHVDMDDKGYGTLKRTKKKSYSWMKLIIETNGAALEEDSD